MKKLIGAAMLAAITVAPMAQANEVVLAEGTILIGNPGGLLPGGVSEILEGCGFGTGEFNNIDGIAFVVPGEALNRAATLTITGQFGVDADVYWYTAACGLVDDFTMANTLQANETGVVPADAAYGVIDLIVGADVDALLTYTA